MNIGVFDSGIGGLTVLKSLIENYPNNHYIYYADNKNNPYGNKSKKELLEIVKNIVNFFIEKQCSIIVIACNTISSTIYEELNSSFKDIIFIRTLPPFDIVLENKALFLSTINTSKSNYVKNNIGKNTINLPCSKLAKLIEKNNDLLIKIYLKKLLKPYKNIKFKYLILGCTHYPLKKDIIKKYINVENTIDSSITVIQNIKKYIKDTKFTLDIYNSNNDKKYTYKCKKIIDNL